MYSYKFVDVFVCFVLLFIDLDLTVPEFLGSFCTGMLRRIWFNQAKYPKNPSLESSWHLAEVSFNSFMVVSGLI